MVTHNRIVKKMPRYSNARALLAAADGESLARVKHMNRDRRPPSEWTALLRQRSSIRSEAAMSDALRERLNNLRERGLARCDVAAWSITPTGREWLRAG